MTLLLIFGFHKKTCRQESFPLKSSLIKRFVHPHIYNVNCSADGEIKGHLEIHKILKDWISLAREKWETLFLQEEKKKQVFKIRKKRNIKESLSFGPVVPESSVENKHTMINTPGCLNLHKKTRKIFLLCVLLSTVRLPVRFSSHVRHTPASSSQIGFLSSAKFLLDQYLKIHQRLTKYILFQHTNVFKKEIPFS